jgi:hypothetical protein
VPIKNEIARAVYSMLEALTVFKDRKELSARIERGADEFNALLSSALQSFPDATAMQLIAPLSAADPVIVLVARLAVLKSALDSELIRLHRGDVVSQNFYYWRHTTGRFYAVEFRRGKLWAACGPIACADVDPRMLPYLLYHKGEIMQWVDRHRREFTVYTTS